MNEMHDPNLTAEVASVPADSLDAGLAAGFGKIAQGPRSTLGAMRPVLLKEAEGESAHLVKPKSDAMPPPEHTGDRYQLQGEIARGGMGAVLRGRDVDLGRDLAVKVLLEKYVDRPEVARRFIEEAQIGGQLQHPGVVPVYDIGRFGERPFFTMKLLKGQTMAALLAERSDPTMDRSRFLAMALQVAQTMAYAHAKGVIHRDLKPANIMVGAFGEVQVMDWGLAKVLAEGGIADEERAANRERERPEDVTTIRTARSSGSTGSFGSDTEAGSLLGTPAYMPPEQANGDVANLDRRCDVFGLGAIMCEILTGKPPYVGRSSEEVRRKACNGDLADALARLNGCGADQELLVLTKACLSPEAIDRPKDAHAVADGLAAYLNGVQARAQAAERERAVAVARAIEERRRRKVQLALAASVLAFLTLGGLSAAYYFQHRFERERQQIEQAAAVDRVVSHAVTLHDQALAHPEDVSRWQVALAAVEQAEVGDDATAHERLQDVRTEIQAGLDAAERDRKLLDRLVEIRIAEADDPFGSRTDADYAAAFREAGIDLAKLTPAEAAAKIKARPPSVAPGLTAALDDWAATRRGRRKDAAGAGLLSRAAQFADPDPWRNELRTALDQTEKTARLKALQTLAKTAKFEELGPISLHLLGTGLKTDGDSAGAEPVLRKAQQRHPRDVWINFELGNVLQDLNRTDEAVRFYTAARAIRPETAHPLAHALAERGDFDEAVAVFCDLVALRPKQVQHIGCLRWTLEQRGLSLKDVAADIDRAVAPLREAVRLRPDDAEAHTTLGRTLFLQGKLDEAIAEIRTVRRLEPNRGMDWAHWMGALGRPIGPPRPDGTQSFSMRMSYSPVTRTPDEALSEVSFLHANALRAQGKLDDAIARYQEAVRLKPNYPEAYSVLIPALKAQGKLDNEVAASREAIRLKPDDAVAYFYLARLLQAQGDFAGALGQYRKGHELGSKNPDSKQPSAEWIAEVSYACANGLREQGKLDEAIIAYLDAVRLKPNYDAAYSALVPALKAQGKLDKEVAASREAIRLKPDAAVAYFHLGRLLQGQGEFAEAVVQYRKGHELDSKRPDWNYMSARWVADLSYTCGNGLKEQGKLDEAIVAYRETIRLRDYYEAKVFSDLVQALKARGKLDKEVAACREAIRLKPDDAETYLYLGGLLEAQGDTAGALALYRQGHDVGNKQPGWKDPSAQWVTGAERRVAGAKYAVESAERLRAVVKGEATPKDNIERLEFARTCEQRKWLAAAARLTGEALESDPKLGDNLQERYRHQATGRAVLAGDGQGEDDPRPDKAARNKLRAQARDWFRADLRWYAKTVESGKRSDCAVVVKNLQHWKVCPDLASIRDPEARKKLPEAERKEWQALWEEAEALLKRAEEADPRLRAVLRGEDKPAGNSERLAYAQVAYDRKHFVVATRLWTEALESDDRLANNLGTGHRYNAACAAALAGAGQGEDAAKLDDQERARLRKQALDWLRADLALRTKQLESGQPADLAAAQKALQYWQQHSDLAGIRDPAALAKLSADGRAACEKLWADVAALLKKAETPAKKDAK
jgi:serine/threonine-protein kinase